MLSAKSSAQCVHAFCAVCKQCKAKNLSAQSRNSAKRVYESRLSIRKNVHNFKKVCIKYAMLCIKNNKVCISSKKIQKVLQEHTCHTHAHFWKSVHEFALLCMWCLPHAAPGDGVSDTVYPLSKTKQLSPLALSGRTGSCNSYCFTHRLRHSI